MKTKYKILIGIGILIAIGILYIFISGLVTFSFGIDRVKVWCEENNISLDNCYLRTHECFNDCKSLNLEYFKLNVQTGFFSKNECYCRLNSGVNKIW